MHIKAKKPVFVPFAFQDEIEQYSKASLMDIAWDLAQRCAMTDKPDKILAEFRQTANSIMVYRNKL
jgi:hypothetical protein